MRVLASTPAIAGILALAASLLLVADLASAKPTDAQLSAIKANCRSDFMSNCWGVPRGGAEAFQCLKDHMAKLSAGCQQAVKAVIATSTPPANSGTAQTASKPATETKPSAAPAQPATASPQTGTNEAAKSNATGATSQGAGTTATTASATTSSGQTTAPAKTSQSASVGASASQAKSLAKKSSTATANAAPEGASSVPAASAAKTNPSAMQAAVPAAASANETPQSFGFIPPRKKLMVLRSCRHELDTYCAGVAYGEGRELRCLMTNRAALSLDCQSALAKLAR
jgi:hypothetical protein